MERVSNQERRGRTRLCNYQNKKDVLRSSEKNGIRVAITEWSERQEGGEGGPSVTKTADRRNQREIMHVCNDVSN